ncbi:signal transduction histidine kinase [Fontibacillus solani]|uniref:histidine kinase n=1 Tax=Fontibacillus solani TaxID=1572857 RepID=A0A7W3SVB8_9BACL|nr:sensor histidine kinase [Fontibacillus solani]MBA9086633.1 signal transduction histidine kinase [Fontibacillus solani]
MKLNITTSRQGHRFLLSLAVVLAAAFLVSVVPIAQTAWASKSTPSQEYTYNHGSIDLSDWNVDERTSILLSGEWEFYWGELLEPKDFQASYQLEPAYVQVPSAWTAYRQGEISLPNEGYATYRLRFLLPDHMSSTHRTLAVYPKSIASSYKMWINGNLKGGNGTVGTDSSSSKPSSYPMTIYFDPVEGWNEVVIQVSNFSQRNAGIWQAMELGTAESVTHLRISRVTVQVFIVGIFFVMSLYYLFVYFNRRQETSALWFGLLCFAVGVRTIVLGETTALYLLPSIPWEAAVKLEYISVSMTALMLILFINREYPKESVPWVAKTSGIVILSCISIFLFTPARVYTYYLSPFTWGVLLPSLLYTMYIYVLSAIRRRKGSLTTATGFLFFTLFALNDMLFYNGLLFTNDMLSIGLLVFLMTQALNLSARFSRALHEKEMLSAQLQEYNRSLERTVEERTKSLWETNKELQEANERMADIEQFRIRLLSNISHELSTPITSIKGFAKGLRDGIITVDMTKYAGRIYERSLLLERLIHDLIELTKLETKQVEFQMHEVELLPFFQEMFMKYADEIEQNGIRFLAELPDNSMELSSFHVRLDPIRIEQVLSNLISNAVRYTPSGGEISLHLHVEGSDTNGWFVYISVKDTGLGIDPAMHGHIFERFGQARQPTGKEHSGSGLGLAISREIILYHQGEIQVESEPGSGSEFRFHLPIRGKSGA